MRLSEAIRLGALLRPQGFYWFFHDFASCAQGAALEAVGVAYESHGGGHDLMRAHWLWADQQRASCPVCGHTSIVRGVIAHLNNDHRWTREAIADFVATVEPAPAGDAIGQPTSDASGAVTRV